MKTLIILRGLPGAGKTTLIKELEKQYSQEATICSADHYFYFGKERIPENYKYDINLRYKAHGSCKYNFAKSMEEGKELIIIDNTNINLRDFKGYILNGAENGYKVICHTITGMDAEDSFKLNVHNVPMEVCVKMYKAFEKCPRKIIGTNIVVEVEEIIHNYIQMRKGFFGNGNFTKKTSKKSK